jgi:AcrR family transcriptional regulator
MTVSAMATQKTDAKRLRIDAIINTAHQLFETNGYEQVGIREICQSVGLSPTQLYRLDLTKQDLLAEVILRVNQEQINRIKPFTSKGFKSAQAYIESYLLNLYESDIQIKSIRAEGAAFGWKWSGKYESLIIEQVFKLIKPIADALEYEGYDEIQARCYAIWSLYYVGYRHAVMQNADAKACLEGIRPSLKLCLKK